MIGVTGFVERVEQIAARKLTYRTGGVGADGTCDCIGLVMGAMYELGHKKYDLHSTNYFARYQTMELREVKKESELFVGQLLFSARESTDKLADRYKPGGAHYNGDLLDYYHVELVTSKKPLRIVECTQYGSVDGIEVSTKLSGRRYGGKLRGVLYDGFVEEDTMSVLYKAEVITSSDPLNLRDAPKGKKIGELPKGALVDVIADGEWARVRYGDLLGYASADYLQRVEADTAEPETGELTVKTVITDEAGRTFEPVGAYTAKTVLVVDGEEID